MRMRPRSRVGLGKMGQVSGGRWSARRVEGWRALALQPGPYFPGRLLALCRARRRTAVTRPTSTIAISSHAA